MDFGEVYTFKWKTQLQSAVFWACITVKQTYSQQQRENDFHYFKWLLKFFERALDCF